MDYTVRQNINRGSKSEKSSLGLAWNRYYWNIFKEPTRKVVSGHSYHFIPEQLSVMKGTFCWKDLSRDFVSKQTLGKSHRPLMNQVAHITAMSQLSAMKARSAWHILEFSSFLCHDLPCWLSINWEKPKLRLWMLQNRGCIFITSWQLRLFHAKAGALWITLVPAI